MKLEIRNYYESDRAQIRGEVSPVNPMMAVLLDINEYGDKYVKNIVAGKNLNQLLRALKLKKNEVEIVDFR
jgi:hypothetical protein